MTDIMCKVLIVVLAVVCAAGAKIILSLKTTNPIEAMVVKEVEKVSEEVIKEETGGVVDLEQIEKKVDGSDDLKQP